MSDPEQVNPMQRRNFLAAALAGLALGPRAFAAGNPVMAAAGSPMAASGSALMAAAGAAAPDAEALLARADDYRNFRGKAFSFDLALTSFDADDGDKSFEMKVEVLDSHTSLVMYDAPVSERGKALLMERNNLWFSSPGASKPIRITPQQRLVGEASNGDVASTDFSGDYAPSLLASEAADGIDCHKLQLDAKPGTLATYSRVHLWVRADNAQPVRAEFFGPSGKLIKTARYTRFEKVAGAGKAQLVELEIANPLNPGRRTVMKYRNFKVGELPESHFTVAYLGRLR